MSNYGSYANQHFDPPDYIQVDSPANQVDGLLQFEIGPLASVGTAQKAYLGLYAYYVGSPGGDPPGHVDLFANQGPFDPASVTWNNAPAYGPLISTAYTQNIGWYAFDITSIYNGWVQSPGENYGVRLAPREHVDGDGGYDGVATLFYTAAE